MKRCATDGAPFEAVVPAPFGAVAFAGRDGRLENLQLLDAGAPLQASSEGLAPMIAEQLAAYFADPGFRFDLALNLRGTEFQQRVWAALRTIPSGQVRTYGEIARDLNSSARAVGGACRANPVPVVVPCHRVVAIGGPGGFAGRTDGAELQRKRWLLAHEGVRR